MIFALDVQYFRDPATGLEHGAVAAVGFATWSDPAPAQETTVRVPGVAAYEPGAFFKRELPCLRAILTQIPTAPQVLVLDSYVDLEPGHPGLGRRLYDALDRQVPVIGVAKTRFRDAPAAEVFRGESRSPLYVTAAGTDLLEARNRVRWMHGEHRIPTLLKRVDRLAREMAERLVADLVAGRA